jgi:hypothetical protein
MTMKRILGAAICGVFVAAAGVAMATGFTSSRQVDFFASGNHEFYVWGAGGSDYFASMRGTSAEDAQMKLYNAVKAAGRTTCWPVWQGRVAS